MAKSIVPSEVLFGPTFGAGGVANARLPSGYRNAADVLEGFTHALSYALGRATRSTGVCAPARLADLVCDRARCYVGWGLGC